ncbi:NADH-ubiquinone oxidoreductase-F iron-sulfur binding region domain-containing protein [Klenkia terrae]|uniref:NADH-ubiquinone oxidoreductase-F iron-sulfur binding region domain-containing protein n=1 Tax=Klenkia terrae TaxID=1052259 RepID=UPI001CD86C91|nr:NADH-ubiquinone oxidoreductase-F iron-sulfur binding region domain-containing protein [Klenkia terrae]
MSAPPLTRGLLGTGEPGLTGHLTAHGPLPAVADLAAAAGDLTGRGGAGFPTARKLRAVTDAARATGRAAVVVGNGGEGEPAAAKDAVLLARSPHLVLDGLHLAGRAVGADTLVLAAAHAALPGLDRALAERGDRARVRLVGLPDRFLAGEESALVSVVDGGPPLPRTKVPPVRERGVGGRPTLVLNVETLARLALLARGDDAGGHTLVTRHTAGPHGRVTDVAEVPVGSRLADVLPLAGARAVLVGGYHGSWLPTPVAADLSLDRDSLACAGASLGAGVLAALPADRCGLRETASVVAHLAAQSAGQCGPCLNGLPRIAAALELLARPAPAPHGLLDDVHRWSGLVVGRGACSHPDGSVRFVASALRVFAPELAAHAAGRCSATTAAPFLPVPGGAR